MGTSLQIIKFLSLFFVYSGEPLLSLNRVIALDYEDYILINLKCNFAIKNLFNL